MGSTGLEVGQPKQQCTNGEQLPSSDGSTFQVLCDVGFLPVEPPQVLSYSGIQECVDMCTDFTCMGVYGNYTYCYLYTGTVYYDSVSAPAGASPLGAFGAYIVGATNGRQLAPAPITQSGSSLTTFPTPSATVAHLGTSTSGSTPQSVTSSTTESGLTPVSSSNLSGSLPTPGPLTTSSSAGSSTPTSTTNASHDQGGSSGFSSGTVAGAAIGAAVGAALIAFLIAFWCFRRRRPRSESSGALLGNEKAIPAHPWDSFLPQPADDGKVSSTMSTLLTQIDQHVENYYSNNFQSDMFDRSRGYLGMVDSGRLPGSLEQLMPEVQNPLPIIKHCFAWYILGKLSPSSTNSEETLLPAEFGRLPPRLAIARGRRGEGEAADQAYNYWRVLTAYLMYPNATSNGGRARGDQLGLTGTQTVDVLTTAFAPWAKSAKAGQEHLTSVLKNATDTGLLVLSQSSSFIFEWDVLHKEDGSSVVVTPAFVKTADEHGRSLAQRQILVKPTVESI